MRTSVTIATLDDTATTLWRFSYSPVLQSAHIKNRQSCFFSRVRMPYHWFTFP